MLQLCQCWQSQILSPQPMWTLLRCGGRTGRLQNIHIPPKSICEGCWDHFLYCNNCRTQFKKRACASVRKSLDMAWSPSYYYNNTCTREFPPIPEQMQKKLDHPVWWAFPVLIMTRRAFFATLHHCRACFERLRCPSLWGGRLSHSSALTR